jgi:hypothetical protein
MSLFMDIKVCCLYAEATFAPSANSNWQSREAPFAKRVKNQFNKLFPKSITRIKVGL